MCKDHSGSDCSGYYRMQEAVTEASMSTVGLRVPVIEHVMLM